MISNLKRWRSIQRCVLIALCWTLATATSTSAQPAPPPDERTRAGMDELRGPAGADQMRLMLTRRLESIQQEQAEISSALEMLDRGEPVEAVRQKIQANRPERDDQRERSWERDGLRGNGRPGDDSRSRERFERWGSRFRTLSEEQRQQVLDFMREHDPEAFEMLDRIRTADPEKFRRMLDDRAPRILRLLDDKEERPEVFEKRIELLKLEKDLRDLSRPLAEVQGDLDQEVIQDIRELVTRQFHLGIELQKADVALAKDRVLDMENRVARMEQDASRMIEERVQRVIERAQSGWSKADKEFQRPGRSSESRQPKSESKSEPGGP